MKKDIKDLHRMTLGEVEEIKMRNAEEIVVIPPTPTPEDKKRRKVFELTEDKRYFE
jgi:hypothetical protein